jgi:NADPH:quinone reductase-like Zn-dependent oxidoreductase
MKAIVFPRYGSPDVLRLQEVEKPTPKDNEVLIKVYAASVNALDRHAIRSRPMFIRIMAGNGVRRPKDQQLGVDLAGRVEAVGANVTRFHIGDAVFGRGHGAFAEYACAREDALALKPAAITFEAAAAVPIGALTALAALRDHGHVRSGQTVLINGAAGAVGTFAVQLAKYFGAEVTAVCGSHSVDTARSLGADHVFDYTREDVTRSGQQYDLILGVNGYHSLFAYRRMLRPGGTYVMVGAATTRLLRSLSQTLLLGRLLSRAGGKQMRLCMTKPTPADLAYLTELLETGKLVSVVERCYPLSETAEAMRYLEQEHARGKVVIAVASATHTQPGDTP